MTAQTLQILRQLLHAQALTVGADDFAEMAAAVTAAKVELDDEIQRIQLESMISAETRPTP